MRFDQKCGNMKTHPNGLFLVDGETDYLKPMQANDLQFLGARADEILKASLHHNETLFKMAGAGGGRRQHSS